jgi:hypothetical protein
MEFETYSAEKFNTLPTIKKAAQRYPAEGLFATVQTFI